MKFFEEQYILCKQPGAVEQPQPSIQLTLPLRPTLRLNLTSSSNQELISNNHKGSFEYLEKWP